MMELINKNIFRILNYIVDNPRCFFSEICRDLDLYPSTLAGVLVYLEDEGFIIRGDIPEDSRKRFIITTKKGLDLVSYLDSLKGLNMI